MNKNYLIIGLAVALSLLALSVWKNGGSLIPGKSNKNVGLSKGFYNPVVFASDEWKLSTFSGEHNLYVSDDMSKSPMKSSAWWKHVAVNGCGTSLFPTPYIAEIRENEITIGLQVSNPTARTIFVKRDPSLKIKLDSPAEECRVKSGDALSSVIEISSGEKFLELKMVKGSPKIIVESENYGWELESNQIRSENNQAFLTDHAGNEFAVLSSGGNTSENKYVGGIQVISYIPDNIDRDEYLKALTPNFIIPVVSLDIDENHLIQKFSFDVSEPYVLLPHHQKYLDSKTEIYDYKVSTPKGKLSLIVSNEIVLKFPLQVPDIFPDVSLSNDEKNILRPLLATDVENVEQDIKNEDGVYWKGKTLSRYANLMYVADLIDNEDTKNKILSALKDELGDWFEYSGEEDSKYFAYDESAGSLISSKPEFGHEELNDHHFHYGYYLYAMAAISKYDREFAGKYSGMVEYLIRDVASFDVEDPSFPHLRNFDLYDGHSYASGLNYMVDGNNQESSSEAVNFWYGAYMWELESDVGDHEVAELMLAGYTLESVAVKEYYFNSGSNSESFPNGYEYPIKSIIFEGKHDYATWFSADPNAIHGIQVLPVTLGSMYLVDQEFSRVNYDFQKTLAPDPETWKDITALYLILNQNEDGKKMLDSVATFDSGNSRTWSTFIYYLISNRRI